MKFLHFYAVVIVTPEADLAPRRMRPAIRRVNVWAMFFGTGGADSSIGQESSLLGHEVGPRLFDHRRSALLFWGTASSFEFPIALTEADDLDSMIADITGFPEVWSGPKQKSNRRSFVAPLLRMTAWWGLRSVRCHRQPGSFDDDACLRG